MDQKNEGHLDLRQRKTRALLVKALAELMEERPFSELSVVCLLYTSPSPRDRG